MKGIRYPLLEEIESVQHCRLNVFQFLLHLLDFSIQIERQFYLCQLVQVLLLLAVPSFDILVNLVWVDDDVRLGIVPLQLEVLLGIVTHDLHLWFVVLGKLNQLVEGKGKELALCDGKSVVRALLHSLLPWIKVSKRVT